MILEQKLYCNWANTDEVFLKVAEEIKKGYHVTNIEHYPFECSIDTVNYKPSFAIILRKKGINYESKYC